MRTALLFSALLAVSVEVFAHDVTFELKALELERIDWSERRQVKRASFATHVPGGVARALSSSPNAKIVHRILLSATDGKTTRISILSREAALALELTPQILPNRELAVDIKVSVEIRLDPEPPFTTDPIHHVVRIPEGESIVVGGFVNDAETRWLQGMPEFKDNPLLQYLFSQKRGTAEESEIVLMLSPSFVGLPDVEVVNAAPKTQPEPSERFLYTVQVGAFANAAAAGALLAELKKRYNEVFIQQITADRTLHRVRVGRLQNLKSAKQLEQQLRTQGFQPFVAPAGKVKAP
jgi:hypothetical protein